MNLLFKKIKSHLPFINLLGGVKCKGVNKLSLLKSLHVRGTNNVIEAYSRLPKDVQIYIYGSNNHLVIENNVTFKKGVIWFEDNDCEMAIGEGTTIEEAHLAVAEDNSKLIIGLDCMISSNVRISTTDSHSIIDLTTGKRTNCAKDIVIGNHTWIAYNVSVNKGCTIGNNSIVAGNSVVTKSIPSNVVAAGIPAKVIKQNVTWDRKRL